MVILETDSPATLRAVIIVLTVLDLVVVALRFYTRYSLRQSVKADDWFALVAFFFVVVLAVYLQVGITAHYVGYPLPADFTGLAYNSTVSGSLELFYIWCLLLFPTLWLIKSSFILYYRRIFVIDKSDFKDWTNVVLLIALVFVAVWTLAFGLPWAFVCHPVSSFWGFPYGDDEGPCVDTWELNRAISISDFLVDVLIILLPVPMVWKLHLPTSRKMAVIMVFFLGAIACAASAMRLVRVVWASSLASDSDVDGLLVNSTVLFWGMIEANLGLLAACLPTLRGFFRIQVVDSFLRSYRSRISLMSRRSSKSTGQNSLPFANSPVREHRSEDRRRIYPQDITLTTMDSVVTSDMSQIR